MNKCAGRRSAFLYVCMALGLLLPVTRNVKQPWLRVVPAVFYGMQPGLPWSSALLLGRSGGHLQLSGLRKGFLEVVVPYCVHHGSDSNVTCSSFHTFLKDLWPGAESQKQKPVFFVGDALL